MKKTLIIAALIAGTWIGVSHYGGGAAKTSYQTSLDKMTEYGDITVVSNSYERYVFSSKAVTELKLANDHDNALPSIVIETQVYHGPISFGPSGAKLALAESRSVISLKATDDSMKNVLERLKTDGETTVDSIYDYNGMVDSVVTVPNTEFKLDDNEFKIEGITINSKSDINFTSAKGELNTGVMLLKVKDAKIEFDAGQGTFDLNRLDEFYEFALGTTQFNIPTVRVESSANPVANTTLKSVAMNSETNLSDGKINTVQDINIESISSIFPLSNASYRMELNGLNPEALKAWREFQADMDLETASQEDFKEILGQFLEEGLEFNNQFDILLFEKPAKFDLDITYVGPPNGTSIKDFADPTEALSAIEAKLYAEVDEQTIAAFDPSQSVNIYVEAGFVTSKNGKLVLQAELKDSEFFLNGKPFPVMQMLGGQASGL